MRGTGLLSREIAMSRLDRHVNLVRTKLLVGTLLSGLAWALLAFASVVLAAVLADRFLLWRLPGWEIWFLAGLGAAVLAAGGWAILRRPTARQAAVAIDERLGLKEKFSTALYVRAGGAGTSAGDDPFAAAAVRDAEATADNVSLHKRFPVAFPRHGIAAACVAVTAAGAFLLDPHPLFGSKEQAAVQEPQKAATDQAAAKKLMAKAIEAIDAAPPEAQRNPQLQAARAELAKQVAQPSKSAQQQQQTALKTMQDLDALKQKIADGQRFDDGKQASPFKDMQANSALDDKSALKDVPEALQKGQFNKAAESIEKVVQNFNGMKKEDQQKAAADTKKVAQQLQQQAQAQGQQQQQLQQKLQQMGANQQQLQQLQNLMQAAAQGDQQAKQQLQQAMNQMAQQINQAKQNMTPAQQQAAAQQAQAMMQQMQQAANNQAAAQNLADAAQQLAQAMQQQANGQQPNGQQQQQGGQQQQANNAQGGQPQPGGQQQPQPGQQQANGQQPNGQNGQGQQPGMQGAGQNLQEQLAQLQQAAQDAQQGMGPGQDGAAPDNLNQQAGNGQQPGQGQGDGKGGKNDQVGQGGGQWTPEANQAAGGVRPKGAAAPYAVKAEKSPTQTNSGGELIASQFIKAPNVAGQSRAELRKVIQSVVTDPAEPVDQDKIGRQEASIVKKYYDDLGSGPEPKK